MAKEYYECHITLDPSNKPHVQNVLAEDHWTFSELVHDIVLGVGPKFYATKHYNTKLTVDQVWQTMLETKGYWEDTHNLLVLRMKIEVVVKDERYDNG